MDLKALESKRLEKEKNENKCWIKGMAGTRDDFGEYIELFIGLCSDNWKHYASSLTETLETADFEDN